MTYNELILKYLEFEETNKLFDLKYFNINFWQYVRYNVFAGLRLAYFNAKAMIPGFNENADLKQSKAQFKELLKSVKNTQVLIFNHPRRSLKDGVYVNVHTDNLAKELNKTFSVRIVEEPFLVENKLATQMHLTPCFYENISYTDSIENVCGAKIRIFKQSSHIKKFQNFISKLIALISENFPGCDIEYLQYILTNQILYVKFAPKLFKKLLKKSKAKVALLFYSPSHTKSVLCAVGKQLKIPMIDLQHGMQTEFEPFFYVVKNKQRYYDIFPDKIFAFGKTTVNTTNYAKYLEKQITHVGNVNLEQRYEQLKYIKKPSVKNILFISQTVLGHDLKEVAKQLANLLKDNTEFHIFYKLHPYEDPANFADLNNIKNISVVTNIQEDINYLQKISYCQVGVFSTALYEGIKYELPTFIVDNLYGAHNTYELLKDLKCVKYVTNANEIFTAITTEDLQKPTAADIQKFWFDKPLENITKLLKEIINEK